MATTLTIPSSAYDGFSALIKIGPAGLLRLAERIDGYPLTLDVAKLSSDLAPTCGTTQELLEQAISKAVLPLSRLRSDLKADPRSFLETVGSLIETQRPEWHVEHGDGWNGISAEVAQLIGGDGSFLVIQKALQLLAERSNPLRDIRIVANVLPIFSEDAAEVRASLLTGVLSIDYRGDDGSFRTVNLSLDPSDLGVLREQLDRAVKMFELLEVRAPLMGGTLLSIDG